MTRYKYKKNIFYVFFKLWKNEFNPNSISSNRFVRWDLYPLINNKIFYSIIDVRFLTPLTPRLSTRAWKYMLWVIR